MREIEQLLELYGLLAAERTPCALATVVDIAGSSYRRIGARMLVAADGRFAGGISGGCLEGDARQKAKRAILAGHPTRQVYDTLEGEDRTIGIGLGCNGRIEVLFVPIDHEHAHQPLHTLAEVAAAGAEVTLLQVTGGVEWQTFAGRLYAPHDTAALARRTGLDATKLAALHHDASGNRSRIHALLRPTGSRLEVLAERIRARMHLYVVGHNYDVYALLDLLRVLDWSYTLVGPLGKYRRAAVAGARGVLAPEALTRAVLGPADNVILMTHDYATDLELLPALLSARVGYLGLLGPRKRTAKLQADLPGVELLGYPGLFAPVGLDVGAETPEEIALAVTAEVLAVRRQRAGAFLRQRPGTIHERTSGEA